MYNCIIFDIDGTLIDTEMIVNSAYQKVIYEEFGRYFTQEELKVGYGVPTHISLERYGFKNIEKACEDYHRYWAESVCNAKPFQGVLEMLGCLQKQGITTGVVTSRNTSEIEEDACLQGLLKYFHRVVCADDTEKHKPHPEPILNIMEYFGAEAAKTIYIGDTYFDSMCARDAGVKFALALWGAKNTDHIHPDFMLKEPREVLNFL